MSRVNRAYHRFFGRLFDASELGTFARADYDEAYSGGHFHAGGGRTAGAVGGTVGVVVGGAVGLASGLALGVGGAAVTFGASAPLAPALVAIPTYVSASLLLRNDIGYR
jgi:hypothetical protein